MHGLNQYDFHARQYDMARLQFTTPDPLLEEYYSWSPYVYCMNNPMKYVDPDGKSPALALRAVQIASKGLRVVGAAGTVGTISRLTGVLEGSKVMTAIFGSPEDIVKMKVQEIEEKKEVVETSSTETNLSIENEKSISISAEIGSTSDEISDKKTDTNKGTLSGTKKAVKEAQDKVEGSLPKGKPGKKGSPQRGDSKKGYRLDPGHPNRPKGDPESGPHVNWWD